MLCLFVYATGLKRIAVFFFVVVVAVAVVIVVVILRYIESSINEAGAEFCVADESLIEQQKLGRASPALWGIPGNGNECALSPQEVTIVARDCRERCLKMERFRLLT